MTRGARLTLAVTGLALAGTLGIGLFAYAGYREHLLEDDVRWDLKMMAIAIAGYAADHDGVFPEAIDDILPYMLPPELLETDLSTHELFRSAYGPAPDHGPDYVLCGDLAGRHGDLPATMIIAVDRAALFSGRSHVIVLLAEGATWRATRDELRGAFLREENQAFARQLNWP